MKFIRISSIALSALIIPACSSHKKSTGSTITTATVPVAVNAPVPSSSTTGIFAPGEKELAAIQPVYKNVTMQTLIDGHALYTGTCTGCHNAVSIYSIQEASWTRIIDDMALRANISKTEKDAVLKYVLSIKATQPAETKDPGDWMYNPGK
jgi:hypothetical protein